jgi:8-oxo-dGTP pyrophosphatase MutT (NUDIX family)
MRNPIDFTVSTLIFDQNRILLVYHKSFDRWLPPGGHIEPNEDPEEAAIREAKEETGLDIKLIGKAEDTQDPDTKPLIRPRWLDIHKVTDTHRHICFYYYARSVSGTLTLCEEEHSDIGWFSKEDVAKLKMSQATRFYVTEALNSLKE